MKAAGAESSTWNLRGLSIAAIAFSVGIHTVTPRLGRWLQDILSAVKLFILAFIVCTGFAAFGGHLRIPRTGNLDVATSFKGTSSSGYNIGTALLDATFSFAGYDNLNMVSFSPSSLDPVWKMLMFSKVLSEVKNPNQTLRTAIPTAMSCITVLYILANIAYVCCLL